MNTNEFEQVASKLGELEDYLRNQALHAAAVGHIADAGAFNTALTMAIAAHAQCQLLLAEPGDR